MSGGIIVYSSLSKSFHISLSWTVCAFAPTPGQAPSSHNPSSLSTKAFRSMHTVPDTPQRSTSLFIDTRCRCSVAMQRPSVRPSGWLLGGWLRGLLSSRPSVAQQEPVKTRLALTDGEVHTRPTAPHSQSALTDYIPRAPYDVDE